jgi:hypothetical protein
MYTDEELNTKRFVISRACDAINRRIDRDMDHSQMFDLYEAIDVERSKLSEIVRPLPNDSAYYEQFVKAYNAADEAALAISLAGSASDDDRPGFLDQTKDHLHRTAEFLVMW